MRKAAHPKAASLREAAHLKAVQVPLRKAARRKAASLCEAAHLKAAQVPLREAVQLARSARAHRQAAAGPALREKERLTYSARARMAAVVAAAELVVGEAANLAGLVLAHLLVVRLRNAYRFPRPFPLDYQFSPPCLVLVRLALHCPSLSPRRVALRFRVPPHRLYLSVRVDCY